MTPVRKKKTKAGSGRSAVLLAGVLILTAMIVIIVLESMKPEELPELDSKQENGLLLSCGPEEVLQVSVWMKNGDNWTVEQPDADGIMYMADARDWSVDETFSSNILGIASKLTYESILSIEPEEYMDDLDEFGLVEPKLIASFLYRDGSQKTIRIGEQSGLSDETYYFMLVDGDNRLFAIDAGTVDCLYIEKALLRPVTQPDIQITRMNRISVLDSEQKEKITWKRNGEITDTDENWMITAPFVYPADVDTIAGLKENARNLRLGVFVDMATPENLKTYGLEEPEYVLTLNMAAGNVGTINEQYEYVTAYYPEQEIRIEIGNEKNDMVQYVRYQDAIYTMNRFLLSVFTEADPMESAARYPFMISAECLSEVQVIRDGVKDQYRIIREKKENGETESICEKNGQIVDFQAFEAIWERVLVVTVSGRLPDGWETTEEPHTVYKLESDNGKKHQVALVKFDALHDAVFVDGYALFYLIRNGIPELI